MVIESGARQYVRITGTGQPEIIQQSSSPSSSSSPPKPSLLTPFQKMVESKQVVQTQSEGAVLPMTKQEVMGAAAKNWAFGLHNYVIQRPIAQGQKNRIDVNQQYVMSEAGPSWNRGDVLTGSEVIGLYENVQVQNRQSAMGNMRSNSLLIQQVKTIPSGSLFYPENQGFVVATPEMQNVLGFYKSKGYEPPGGDIGFYKSPSRPSDVLAQIKGVPTSKIIIGSESIMNLGFPFLYAGIAQGITGSPAIERQYQEYAFRGVQSLPGKGMSIESNLLSNLTSQEVIFDVYLPVAMLGVGYAMKPVISPVLSKISGRLAGINTAKMIGGNYVKMSALGVTKVVGIGAMAAFPTYIIGSTAVQNPEALPSVLGHLTSQAIVAGAAFKLGEMSYSSPVVYPRETPQSLTSRTYSAPEIQGKILTKTYSLRGIENPDEIFSHSTVMNWPGRDVQSVGISTPVKIKDIEVLGRNELGVMTRQTESSYNIHTSTMFDEGKMNISIGMSRGRPVKDMLSSDFLGSRSQGFTYSDDITSFYRGTHLQQSFYEGDTMIQGGFLSQRKESFTMVYSRILPEKGLILDVAKVSGGPDLTTSSVITKNILEYIPPSSGFETGGGFPSMMTRSKGYVGSFPSMYPGGLSLSVLSGMEYGIQSSSKWPSMVLKADVVNKVSSKSVTSLVSINTLLSQSQQQSIGKINVSNVGQVQSIFNVSKQISTQVSIQKSTQISVQSLLTEQTTSLNVLDAIGFTALSTPDIITTSVVPMVPFLPFGSLTSGVGGGYGSKKRRKKGSRYRIHPIELYDVLYLSKGIAI
jgi:hypothetical protein